jgi:hypothetical protein
MIIVVDNFLKNPYDIKNHTIKNNTFFSDKSHRWPGERCFEVPQICSNYLLSKTREYFNDETIKYGEVFFHKIPSNEVKCGWTHYDENFRYASILYLNETSKQNVGTEIYDYFWNTNYLTEVETFRKIREKYLNIKNKNIIQKFLFSKECEKFNKNFNKTKTTVSLKFNRYVAYEATRLHRAQNMFIGNNQDRINLICFYK